MHYTFAASIADAASRINQPHKMQPIQETNEVIHKIAEFTSLNLINEQLIRITHCFIFWWFEFPGKYRTVPAGDVQVSARMSRLHPFIISPTLDDGVKTLQEWYEVFVEIKPFDSGSEQVAGAIIAGVSLSLFEKILIPDHS